MEIESGASFLQHAFEKRANDVFPDPLEELIGSEYVMFCQNLDATKLQESWSWRNSYMARKLAKIIINERGDIEKRPLFKAIELLEQKSHSLGPERYHDKFRVEHVIEILKLCASSIVFVRALKSIYKPFGNKGADLLISETLFLDEGILITDAHARQCALAALLCSLRQNVGSCFATAPAILISQDLPERFLADIAQLFGTGRLTRTFEGVEYTVPLSTSWGAGSLFRKIPLVVFGQQHIEQLCKSVGLIAAFEAAGLIEKEVASTIKQQKCAQLLKNSPCLVSGNDFFGFITADQIIKEVLFHECGISDQDLENYKMRQHSLAFAGIMGFAHHALTGKAKGCARYLQAYEKAARAFNAVTDNPLLKAWEFTLASLSESSADVAKWNLYASLGVDPRDKSGIGHALQGAIEEKIRQINKEIEAHRSSYDHLFSQAKYLEGRMTRASSENEMGWMHAEYQINRHDINRVLSEQDALYDKGRKLQGLYPLLIEFYGKKIRDYFQEVYDPQMHEMTDTPYDDSPAGFRLLYKHGRSNPALWSFIHSADEYVGYLCDFFVATEKEIYQIPQFEGLQKEITELVSAAIMTVKDPGFLEGSCVRLAKTYNEPLIDNPLENLDKLRRKPWAYVSGGRMSTLVSCYWQSSQTPKEEKKWVESETELLAFLIDALKECPLSVQQTIESRPLQKMLAYSPTHAYLCRPAFKLFQTGWKSDLYTYTWIRDHFVQTHLKFLDQQLLDRRMLSWLIEQLLLYFPLGYRPIVQNALKGFSFTMSPEEFREKVMKTLSYEKWLLNLNVVQDELDSILYKHLPLFPEYALEHRLGLIFDTIEQIDPPLKAALLKKSAALQENVGRYRVFSAFDLLNFAKGLLIESLESTRSSIFFHGKIVQTMRTLGFCYPEPLLFADTNWVNNFFGFVVNPGNRQLELWRFDASCVEGRSMSTWKGYLNGCIREEWGLFTSLQEYSF